MIQMPVDDAKREKLNEYRVKWRANALGKDLKQTIVYLPNDVHARAVDLAKRQIERLPITLGRLILMSLDILDNRVQSDPIVPRDPPAITTDLAALTRALLRSRFPGDTSSARLRQLAFVNFVAAEMEQGRVATATVMIKLVEAHRSQVTSLGKDLAERGVIEIKSQPKATAGRRHNAYYIRPDALEALAAAHIRITGHPIDMQDATSG